MSVLEENKDFLSQAYENNIILVEAKSDKFKSDTTNRAISSKTKNIVYKNNSEKKKENNNLIQFTLF